MAKEIIPVGMNEIILPTSLEPEDKLRIISDVYRQIEEMIRHLDSLRQRNLNFALIVFAGLFGLGVKVANTINLLFISIPLTILMLIFLLIDRKFHVYNHGFQGSSYKLIHKMSEIRKEGDLVFEKYDYEFAKKAEWKSLQCIIYFSLIAGGIISYFVLPWVQLGNPAN